MLTPKQFHYAFTNTIDAAEAAELYERLPIPGPARPLFQAAFANVNPNTLTKVNYKNDDRAPLLLSLRARITSSRRRRRTPPSSSTASRRRRRSSGVPGPQSRIVGERGWEEVADHAINWAEEVAKRGSTGVPV